MLEVNNMKSFLTENDIKIFEKLKTILKDFNNENSYEIKLFVFGGMPRDRLIQNNNSQDIDL